MPDRHPDVDRLADLHAGLLDSADAAAVRTHVAECVECARVLDDLAEVQTILADVEPEPMPEDVVTRVEAALARADRPATVTPLAPRRRWLRPLVAAAVTVGALSIAIPAWNGVDLSGSDSANSGAESVAQDQTDDAAGSTPDQDPGTLEMARQRFTAAHFDRQVSAALSSAITSNQLSDVEAQRMFLGYTRTTCTDRPAWRIIFEGRPALLRIDRDAGASYAVAFRCSDGVANELAKAPVDPR